MINILHDACAHRDFANVFSSYTNFKCKKGACVGHAYEKYSNQLVAENRITFTLIQLPPHNLDLRGQVLKPVSAV
jgi:hypothetical protein